MSLSPPAAPPVQYRGVSYSADKRYWHGTQRVIPPEETLNRVRPRFVQLGLTRLANVTGLDRIGIPTVLSVRPNGRSLSVDAGKGFTLAAAMASAAMECVERYHAETVELEEIYDSYEHVARVHNVIALNRLPLAKHSLFSPRWPERWTLGWDLIGQCEVAVPTLMVTMQRVRFGRAELLPFQLGSNGLAAGNDFGEAVAGGIMELVERDAITCQRIARQRRGHVTPRVRRDTITSPLVLDLFERCARAEAAVVLFDCTVDTGIPVYEAYLYDQSARHVGAYKGYGAHLDPDIAMVRAITEAVQARLIYVAGSRDDFFRQEYIRHKQSDDAEAIAALEGLDAAADAGAHPSLATSSFHGDIHVMLDRLRAVGLDQVIVVDLTRPEFDVRAVRVICPGLEGYMFDTYTPGARARAFLDALPS